MDFGNDLKSLGFKPQEMPFPVTIMEMKEFYVDYKDQPISLAYLSDHFLGESKQEGGHSSIRDARVTAICYHRMMKLKKEGFSKFACPLMDITRMDPTSNPKLKSTQKWDKCRCNANQRIKNKKRKNKLSSFMNITIDDL